MLKDLKNHAGLSIYILKMIAYIAQPIILAALDHFSHFTLFEFAILFTFCTTFEKLAPNGGGFEIAFGYEKSVS